MTKTRGKSPDPEGIAILNTRQVAELLGVTEPTVRKWRSTGGGPPFVALSGNGGSVRYLRSEVYGWLRSLGTPDDRGL